MTSRTRYWWVSLAALGYDLGAHLWILREYTRDAEGNELITVRERYRHLVCPECHKVDEDEAMKCGFDTDVLRGRRIPYDLIASSDSFVLCSYNFREFILDSELDALRFTKLPGGQFFVVRARQFAHLDRQAAKVRELNQCSMCGRFKEAKGIPPLSAMSFPVSECHIFALDWHNEDWYGRSYDFIVDDCGKGVLEDSDLRIDGFSAVDP